MSSETPLLDPTPMTSDRFCELLNGPLAHPLWPLAHSRIVQALWFVMNCTGQRGADALEAHCRCRDEQDHADDVHPDDLGDHLQPSNL